MHPCNIAILTIGDDLLCGARDTSTIAPIIATYGYRLSCSLSVPDQEKEIVAALRYLLSYAQFIIITGGLGTTGENRTARAAARALQQPLVINEDAMKMIKLWFSRSNRHMELYNEKQALLPQSAHPLPNQHGATPGFHLQHADCELFFLSGVPTETKAMFRQSVLPVLQNIIPGAQPLQQRVFKLFGLSESKIKHMIPYQQLPDEVEVTVDLNFPLVIVKLKANGNTAEFRLDQAEVLLLKKLGGYLMARDGDTPEGNVGKLLTSSGLTISLAESCTGGLLSSMLTSAPGTSAFLERAAVTYADTAKLDWLKVPQQLLQQHGAVSENCARAMASGLRHSAGTDLALAITGIAGPDGGTTEKPVGTVFLALASAAGIDAKRYTFSGNRSRVQHMAATMALEWLRRFALQHMKKSNPQKEY